MGSQFGLGSHTQVTCTIVCFLVFMQNGKKYGVSVTGVGMSKYDREEEEGGPTNDAHKMLIVQATACYHHTFLN